MESTLVVITIVSLVVAAVTSVIAWRLARDERARSDARVAALSATIDDFADAPVLIAAPGIGPGRAARAPHMPTPMWKQGSDAPNTPPIAPEAADVAAVGDMFTTSSRHDRPARHFGPAFVLGALAVSAVVGTLLLAGGAGDVSSKGAGTTAPLELLSLRHVQQGEKTEISGLVRNPRGAPSIDRVTAVVFFFDDAGAFLTSARAPLDFRRLAGGEESAFLVTAPTPPGVRRYRVSFRLAEGGVVPHVDRREN
jgi:hypothetical protein